MKSEQLFAVLIKAIGAWELVGGLLYLPSSILSIFQLAELKPPLLLLTILAGFSYSGLRMIIGGLLFFRSEWLARKVYRDWVRTDENVQV